MKQPRCFELIRTKDHGEFYMKMSKVKSVNDRVVGWSDRTVNGESYQTI